MSDVNAQAVLLKRIDYGDNDLIVTLFIPNVGKLTVIAKSAKKSKKRFPGILEHFNQLSVVYSQNRRGGLPLLKEATLHDAFINIRTDINKTAYAGYWVELIHLWLEEGHAQDTLYYLLQEVLGALDKGEVSIQVLDIYFQMKFLKLVGLQPHLTSCCQCQIQTDCLLSDEVMVSIKDGGIVCCDCSNLSDSFHKKLALSKGTLKQLIWIAERHLPAAKRVRFSINALKETRDFLEAFVPYHVGRIPKSLKFIKRLRGQ
jgi:DNA repair protein RecO (recombination protein O)